MNDYVKGCLSYDPSVYDKRGNRIDAVQLINEMSERIAELEANQAKHNLEQQALGIDNFSCEMLGKFKSDTIRKKIIKHSSVCIDQLRKQAEEL